MRQVVKRISLTQPTPIQIDSTEPDVIATALDQIPGPRDRQLDQPRGRPRQGRHVDPAGRRPRRGADRADHRRGRHGQDGRAQGRDRPAPEGDRLRRARPRPRAADLRRPDLHADHRRRGVAPERGRDDRGHPPRQGRAAASARPRWASRTSPSASASPPARCSTRVFLHHCVEAGLDLAMVNPNHITPYARDLRGGAQARRRPRLRPLRGRAAEVHRALRVARGRGGRGREGRPDRGHGARGGPALPHPAAQEGRRRGLDRRGGREDRRGPDAQRRCCCRR